MTPRQYVRNLLSAAAIAGLFVPVPARAAAVFPLPDYGPGAPDAPDAQVYLVWDFNGDGRKDFVTSNTHTTFDAFLVLTAAGGGFLPPQRLPVQTGYVPVVAGDFDGDGRQDIGVTNGPAFAILFANADGTFAAQRDAGQQVSGTQAAAADFNRDGRQDLAALGPGQLIRILLSNGDGTFTSSSFQAFPANASVAGLRAGDFNGDGLTDLAALDIEPTLTLPPNNASYLRFFPGRGDGTFGPQTSTFLGLRGFETVVVPGPTGDMNGDGRSDFTIIDYSRSGVSVYLGQPDGSFTPMAFIGGLSPINVVFGDFNGDGRADLAISGNDGLHVALNVDNTHFALVHGADIGGAAGADDYDLDGRADLLLNQGALLEGRGNGTFAGPTFFSPTGYTTSFASGDFNADGKPDLAVASLETNRLQVFLGTGDGHLTLAFTATPGSAPAAVVAGDLDGDGRIDLAVANSASNDVALFQGNGDGTFSPTGSLAAGDGPRALPSATGTMMDDPIWRRPISTRTTFRSSRRGPAVSSLPRFAIHWVMARPDSPRSI